MRSRDRLPSQQEILDGSTPSAELSPLEVLRVMQLRSLSAMLRKNSFRGHAASLSERNSCCKPPRTGALIRFVCSVEGALPSEIRRVCAREIGPFVRQIV